MNQPVNPADIHKAIVEQQKIQDRKKLMVNGVLLLGMCAVPSADAGVVLASLASLPALVRTRAPSDRAIWMPATPRISRWPRGSSCALMTSSLSRSSPSLNGAALFRRSCRRS